MWRPQDHMIMGGFLLLLGGWMLGLAVCMLLMAFIPGDLALLIGVAIAGSLALAGLVEFIIGMIGAGVRSGNA
jgi:hypothetical protein